MSRKEERKIGVEVSEGHRLVNVITNKIEKAWRNMFTVNIKDKRGKNMLEIVRKL